MELNKIQYSENMNKEIFEEKYFPIYPSYKDCLYKFLTTDSTYSSELKEYPVTLEEISYTFNKKLTIRAMTFSVMTYTMAEEYAYDHASNSLNGAITEIEDSILTPYIDKEAFYEIFLENFDYGENFSPYDGMHHIIEYNDVKYYIFRTK